jgi:hypothetical protein
MAEKWLEARLNLGFDNICFSLPHFKCLRKSGRTGNGVISLHWNPKEN